MDQLEAALDVLLVAGYLRYVLHANALENRTPGLHVYDYCLQLKMQLKLLLIISDEISAPQYVTS